VRARPPVAVLEQRPKGLTKAGDRVLSVESQVRTCLGGDPSASRLSGLWAAPHAPGARPRQVRLAKSKGSGPYLILETMMRTGEPGRERRHGSSGIGEWNCRPVSHEFVAGNRRLPTSRRGRPECPSCLRLPTGLYRAALRGIAVAALVRWTGLWRRSTVASARASLLGRSGTGDEESRT